MNIIILAGGVGTRLWPLGRKHNPKQFFPMIGKKPLIIETYDRFAKVYGPKKIFFSVTADLVPQVRKLFSHLPARQFIVEPSRRDTGPAMGYVAATLFLSQPDEPMVFVPSDHFIADIKRYRACFKRGEELIKSTGHLVDIGITATFPSTVLGYTKIGKLLSKESGVEVYHFLGHTEKPNVATATRYVTDGSYLWHGNYYMWTPRKFLEAFKNYAPALSAVLDHITPLIAKRQKKMVAELYEKMEKISFDYAVTEKINQKQVVIIKGDFGWSDVGAWDVLHNQLQDSADEKGNVVRGEVVHTDTNNCLIFGHKKRLVATVGLDNMVVVDTEDAILICPKNRAQDIKKLFPILEEKNLKKYV